MFSLQALETTVSFDFTGPAYKFFDDPFLAPYNDRQARMFSLAKNAGQKAATWVRDQHPELFTQVISDPPVMESNVSHFLLVLYTFTSSI